MIIINLKKTKPTKKNEKTEKGPGLLQGHVAREQRGNKSTFEANEGGPGGNQKGNEK